jgi:IS5 family transposase
VDRWRARDIRDIARRIDGDDALQAAFAHSLWLTPKIKREMRRRSAVEPVIGHLKAEHRMDRNYLAHRAGDAANAVLAAAGHNFRLLLRWLRFLLSRMLCDLIAELQLTTA